MGDLDIKFPERDLAAMSAQILRAQKELGKPVEDAVRMAAYYLAKSAGTRTKAAPKTRRALVNRKKRGRFKAERYPYYRKVWKKGRDGGPKNTFKFYLKDRSDSQYEKIARSGLAKKSWMWMLPMIRGGGSNFAAQVERRRSGLNIEIEMSNKLPYIEHALRRKDGDILLMEALGKASRAMAKAIDHKMKRTQK
jgi:hypothetical protein